jgi:hypothetical protein
VRSANDRCNQENLIEQLKNGARALQMPVDNLDSLVKTPFGFWCVARDLL